MKKESIVYQCQSCGFISMKWLGRCPDCGEWNTMVEEIKTKKGLPSPLKRASPILIRDVQSIVNRRLSTWIKEFDRVLGGGVVIGSLIFIGGDPGIGKSTLILQALHGLTKNDGKSLYVSGEESLEQIKLRAERFGIDSSGIYLLSETCLENIIEGIDEIKPDFMVIDSIQTIYTQELPGAPGSVGQVRECASRIMTLTKSSGITTFIIGHVTKEGSIAGPRVLEHLVDTVIYFEGEKSYAYRILRTIKNRFGASNEIGVFEMTEHGLVEIENPSELFLSERPDDLTGTAVTSTIEGTRPILIEFQALVSPATFSVPRRTTIGVDYNRVNLLIAVLEKKAGILLGGMDIFVNVAGGLRVDEPGTDLALISAIVSSFKNIKIHPDTVIFGEVGLSGEVRMVSQAELRLKEASKIGFRIAIIPEGNAGRIKNYTGIKIIGVRDIRNVIEIIS